MRTKLIEISNDGRRDGRLTVLLCFIFCFLIFDFGVEYNWFTFTEENNPKSKKQLIVIHSGLLVIDESSQNIRTEKTKTIPVAFTPFFFQPIPINLATKEMLMTVKGIGPSLAKTILDHRQQIGPFKNPEDLLALKGIGRKRVSSFKNTFTFNEPQ